MLRTKISRILYQYSSEIYKIKGSGDVKFQKPDLIENEKKPLVCVIGWLGCKEKNLNKYVDMYEEIGISTLSTIPNFTQTMSHKKNERIACEFLEIMDELTKEENFDEIIIHTFSGNGLLFYGYLMKCMMEKYTNNEYPEVMDALKGEIFDSPMLSLDNMGNVVKGFVGGTVSKKNSTNGKTDDLYHHWFLTPFFELLTKLSFTKNTRGLFESLISTMKKNKKHVPQLILYSSADPICSVEEIKGYMDDVQDEFYVKSKDFLDSEHCAHMLKYRDDYINTIQEYLEEIKEIEV